LVACALIFWFGTIDTLIYIWGLLTDDVDNTAGFTIITDLR
jgi:hypothetical protein